MPADLISLAACARDADTLYAGTRGGFQISWDAGHIWHHPDQLLLDITKYGVAEALNLPDYSTCMPAFRDVLNHEEIVAILSYIKTRWPSHIRQYQDDINRRFEERSDGTSEGRERGIFAQVRH